MKTSEFEKFIKLGVVGSVVIMDRSRRGEGFELFAYGIWENQEQYTEIEKRGNAIEAARGNRRQWADLDRVNAYVRGAGWMGKIEIDYAG